MYLLVSILLTVSAVIWWAYRDYENILMNRISCSGEIRTPIPPGDAMSAVTKRLCGAHRCTLVSTGDMEQHYVRGKHDGADESPATIDWHDVPVFIDVTYHTFDQGTVATVVLRLPEAHIMTKRNTETVLENAVWEIWGLAGCVPGRSTLLKDLRPQVHLRVAE